MGKIKESTPSPRTAKTRESAPAPPMTLYQEVENCVEAHITLFLFQLRILKAWLFRNEVDGGHVDALRLNMDLVGFMDEEVTVMRIPEGDTEAL